MYVGMYLDVGLCRYSREREEFHCFRELLVMPGAVFTMYERLATTVFVYHHRLGCSGAVELSLQLEVPQLETLSPVGSTKCEF